jgi:four helix bundle protein
MSNFENLKVWHRAVELAVSVYNVTEGKKSLKQDLGLKDQMRRSSVSISSNISEGDELGTDKQAVRHFYIAKGSTAELYTQIIISHKIRYLEDSEKEYFANECKGIAGMLSNLIKSRYSE